MSLSLGTATVHHPVVIRALRLTVFAPSADILSIARAATPLEVLGEHITFENQMPYTTRFDDLLSLNRNRFKIIRRHDD